MAIQKTHTHIQQIIQTFGWHRQQHWKLQQIKTITQWELRVTWNQFPFKQTFNAKQMKLAHWYWGRKQSRVSRLIINNHHTYVGNKIQTAISYFLESDSQQCTKFGRCCCCLQQLLLLPKSVTGVRCQTRIQNSHHTIIIVYVVGGMEFRVINVITPMLPIEIFQRLCSLHIV